MITIVDVLTTIGDRFRRGSNGRETTPPVEARVPLEPAAPPEAAQAEKPEISKHIFWVEERLADPDENFYVIFEDAFFALIQNDNIPIRLLVEAVQTRNYEQVFEGPYELTEIDLQNLGIVHAGWQLVLDGQIRIERATLNPSILAVFKETTTRVSSGTSDLCRIFRKSHEYLEVLETRAPVDTAAGSAQSADIMSPGDRELLIQEFQHDISKAAEITPVIQILIEVCSTHITSEQYLQDMLRFIKEFQVYLPESEEIDPHPNSERTFDLVKLLPRIEAAGRLNGDLGRVCRRIVVFSMWSYFSLEPNVPHQYLQFPVRQVQNHEPLGEGSWFKDTNHRDYALCMHPPVDTAEETRIWSLIVYQKHSSASSIGKDKFIDIIG